MEATIDIEFLQGLKELIIKELAIVSDGVVRTFLFSALYHMEPHGSEENSLIWNDGFILYEQVFTVLNEAVAIYDHLYAMGNDKFHLLNGILGRPVHNYEALQCPDPQELKSDVHCYLTCHSYPHMRCATRHAWALYCWLQYHFRTKSYTKCPPKHSRHTVQFYSGVP